MKQRIIELKDKIKDILENNTKIVLTIMFIIGILIYGYLVSKVTSIAFLGVDEELYISMARTFFYEGVFAKGYEILNYNCVIYSMLISIVYFFYSAKNVLFLMRIIGVILMVSGIFPVYLLSKKVLNSKIKALGVSAIWLVLPEMGLSSYVIQEVLLYPIFLWTAYLVYLKFSGKESKLVDFGIIFLFVIMFFVKSFTISFAVAYFLALLICNGKKNIKKTIFQGIVFLGIVAIGYFGVYAINNFQLGTNHYSSQISRIFPITINTFINFAHGIWYYTVFFLFCTGILPIIMPILNIKRYEEKDRKFIIFLMISAIMTIIETALIVFIPEESNKLYPHKFCYRYLLPIMIPFAIMLLKLKTKEVKITKSITIIYIIMFSYLAWYYLGQGSITTAIDAPVLFCMQYVYKEKLSIVLILMFAIISIAILLHSKKKIEDIRKIYIMAIIVGVAIFTPIYWKNIINLSNNYTLGDLLQPDFEIIAENIKDRYDKTYIIDSKENVYKYVRTIGGQLKNDYRVVSVRKDNRH